MNQKLKQELTKLWTGELAATISFWMVFFICKRWLTNTNMIISVAYPLLVLSFILIQGCAYWYILLTRLSAPTFALKQTRKIYSILKITDIILLCSGAAVMAFHYTNIIILLISLFLWFFAIIEWVNYYEIRLSYSYNPLVLITHIKNRTLKKSRIAKEIAHNN